MSRLPETVQQKLRETELHTEKNSAMTMVVALSYSSRWEITEATKRIATKVQSGEIAINDITEEMLSQNMETFLYA